MNLEDAKKLKVGDQIRTFNPIAVKWEGSRVEFRIEEVISEPSFQIPVGDFPLFKLDSGQILSYLHIKEKVDV